LAIDDFGTGYSSLSYLKRFPLDVLKIDKSFVDEIPFNKDDVAIVKAIIAMAKALGFSVLAEGVERIEQIDFLREQGCDLYQGYYMSRPVCAEAFEKLLIEHPTRAFSFLDGSQKVDQAV
jgi:EAL domain-containing protein (putative c-di-GMP-specific phosphodiesterase class I)